MSITQDGWTPLITAAAYGKCDVVLDLLDSGADVNAQSNVSEPFPADIPGYVHVHVLYMYMYCTCTMYMYCIYIYMCVISTSTCTLYQKVHGCVCAPRVN